MNFILESVRELAGVVEKFVYTLPALEDRQAAFATLGKIDVFLRHAGYPEQTKEGKPVSYNVPVDQFLKDYVPPKEEAAIKKVADDITGMAKLFTKKVAIHFLEWTATHGWQPYDGADRWINLHNNKVLETEQLYEKYSEENA